jgi:hypothetical protein
MSDTVLSAVQHIRKMRGSSQAHLMRASDGNYYVVKFQNCPQHPRVLANEFLATKIGIALRLPMPEVRVIDVPEFLIVATPEMRIDTANKYFPCASGMQLAVRYAGDIWQDHVVDYMPKALSGRVENLLALIQVLVFDKWLCNCDGRQVVFSKPRGERVYRMTCIDQGWCFNAAEWDFPDKPLHGTYCHPFVYHGVSNWDSFEPVLSQVEQFDPSLLLECATDIPEEWYKGQTDDLCRLIESLLKRRLLVRDLITNFRNCSENPFPNWTVT